jgi:hypothetical protein
VPPSWLGEPFWGQFAVLLPEWLEYHPAHRLGCHRRRISDRPPRSGVALTHVGLEDGVAGRVGVLGEAAAALGAVGIVQCADEAPPPLDGGRDGSLQFAGVGGVGLKARTLPPLAAMSAATRWSSGLRRTGMTTFGPSRAKRCAADSPIPDDAPVMRVDLPVSRSVTGVAPSCGFSLGPGPDRRGVSYVAGPRQAHE